MENRITNLVFAESLRLHRPPNAVVERLDDQATYAQSGLSATDTAQPTT